MTSFSLTARMKYELTQTSKESISEKYEEVKESKEPHVIIYSSCWSYYSQITQIMRSCWLLSAIALKKDSSTAWQKSCLPYMAGRICR